MALENVKGKGGQTPGFYRFDPIPLVLAHIILLFNCLFVTLIVLTVLLAPRVIERIIVNNMAVWHLPFIAVVLLLLSVPVIFSFLVLICLPISAATIVLFQGEWLIFANIDGIRKMHLPSITALLLCRDRWGLHRLVAVTDGKQVVLPLMLRRADILRELQAHLQIPDLLSPDDRRLGWRDTLTNW